MMIKKIDYGTGKSALIVVVLLALIVAGIYYFDPPPNPRAPNCNANEIRVFDKEWFCVLARRP